MILGNDDLKAIKDLVKVTIDEELEVKLEQKLTDKLGKFPTKEEYYSREDKMMTELKAIREEITIVSGNSSDHSDRIETLENLHPHGRHSATLQA